MPEIGRAEPGSLLEHDHVETRPREVACNDATRDARADDGEIDRFGSRVPAAHVGSLAFDVG